MLVGKPIEIFCGTGGVGKTTLATSRAHYLASLGKKVLLITIDPAKRLKEILKLKNEDAGIVKRVQALKIDALLMSPRATFERISNQEGKDNKILKILTLPNGGMNEILALVEVEYYFSQSQYDHIILDTPPGKHFIDFLQSTQKIKNFFKKVYIDIFKYLSLDKNERKSNFFTIFVGTGIKKLLKYLDKVTGGQFVHEFVEAVYLVYQCRSSFIKALDLQDQLNGLAKSNWFLVTSLDHQKTFETKELKSKIQLYFHEDSYFVINKVLSPYLAKWKPRLGKLKKIKDSLEFKEREVMEFAEKNYTNILKFGEVFDMSPNKQVLDLSNQWKMY